MVLLFSFLKISVLFDFGMSMDGGVIWSVFGVLGNVVFYFENFEIFYVEDLVMFWMFCDVGVIWIDIGFVWG